MTPALAGFRLGVIFGGVMIGGLVYLVMTCHHDARTHETVERLADAEQRLTRYDTARAAVNPVPMRQPFDWAGDLRRGVCLSEESDEPANAMVREQRDPGPLELKKRRTTND